MCVLVWRPEVYVRISSFALHQVSRGKVFNWTWISRIWISWQAKEFWGPHPSPFLMVQGLQTYAIIPSFYMGAGDLNSDSQACVTETLLTNSTFYHFKSVGHRLVTWVCITCLVPCWEKVNIYISTSVGIYWAPTMSQPQRRSWRKSLLFTEK